MTPLPLAESALRCTILSPTSLADVSAILVGRAGEQTCQVEGEEHLLVFCFRVALPPPYQSRHWVVLVGKSTFCVLRGSPGLQGVTHLLCCIFRAIAVSELTIFVVS